MSKRRRTNPNNKFVMIERWFWRCPAWQALPHPARSLYIELELRFTGQNNGDIDLSVRSAMELIGCSFNFTRKMFANLEAKGFIKARQRGSFGWKARHATTWILTLHEYLGREPTKDFMQWKETEKQNPDAPRASDGRSPCVRGAQKHPLTDAPQASVKANSGTRSDAPQASVLVYQGKGDQESEQKGRAALARPASPRGNKRQRAAWLRGQLDAGVVSSGEVAAAIGMPADDVAAVAAGRTELTPYMWRKIGDLVAGRMN